jgi:hypothetical protein
MHMHCLHMHGAKHACVLAIPVIGHGREAGRWRAGGYPITESGRRAYLTADIGDPHIVALIVSVEG